MRTARARPARLSRLLRGARWLPGLVALCLVALTGAVALGDRASDGRRSDKALGDRAIQADARSSARRWHKRESVAQTTAAREKRATSRTRHRDLSASSALRLTRRQFPAFSSQPAFKGYRPEPGESVERYLGAGTARVSDRAGHRSIVESTYPLRGATPAGRPAPIDLTLLRHGSGFAPASAAVDVRFPARISDGIAMKLGGGARLVVRPAKSRKAKVARLGSGKVIYANTDVDTDTLAAAMPLGVELFTQIRSADSPVVHAFRVDLPSGAVLRRRGRGAEIVRRGQRLGVVNPPVAWDAENRPVTVRLSVAGDRLRLSVPHRGADVAYPVMVDPLIESFQHWRTDPAIDWLYWAFDAPSGFGWSRDGEWGPGAYLTTTGGEYWRRASAHARFAAPGDAHVYAAEFNLLRHQPPNGEPMCASAGIFSDAVQGYESPVWTRCESVWDEDYGTCVEGGGEYPYCDETVGSASNEMRFQYWAYNAGGRDDTGIANMGGALVRISDRNDPLVEHGKTPGGWAESHELSVSARDTGLGLRRIAVTSPTAPEWSGADRSWDCDGSRLARSENLCSSEWESLGYWTHGLPEGIQTLRAVAEDGLPRTSKGTDTTVRIDTLAPEVAISGGLWELRDRVATEGDTFDIRVAAVDGAPEGPDSARRSGVASIEIKAGERQIGFASQTCADSCPLSLGAKLDTDTIPEGPQTISVEVFDQAGHRFFESWTINQAGPNLYASEVASWQETVERMVEEGSPEPLTEPMPTPPGSWRTPSNCRPEDAEVRVCFDFVKQWQTELRKWLEANRATGAVASRLPDMPRYEYGRDRVARWLVRAAVFAFERVRENAANPEARRTALISFHHPVSLEYLELLSKTLGLAHAKSLRGTYEEIGKPITAGAYENPELPEEPLLFQVEAFYEEQLGGIDEIIEGLHVDLRDENDEERAETETTIGEVEEYRTALLGRAPLVTAIVADVNVAALVEETGNIATSIKTADLLSQEVPLEADDAPGTDRSMPVYADEGDPGPEAKPGATEESGYMPSGWNGRTRVLDYRKTSYMGFAWTQPGTLNWYQGDDAHDRGFEAQAYPLPGDAIWSDAWSGGWTSSLPDAYRDELRSEDKYKVFAIGSANGRALKFQKKYFGWFNTNGGDGSSAGTVFQGGQRTVRPADPKSEQSRLCQARESVDKACLFGDHAAEVQTYPLEDVYHRVRRDWP